MPIGYGYVKREASDYIDWSKLGQDFSKMLSDVNIKREASKEAFNQATRVALDNLANAPQGKFQDGNKLITDFAADAQAKIQLDERLFKSGLLKQKDYIFNRQNLVDGTKTMFDLQKYYEDNYNKRMEGVQNGTLQPLNTHMLANVEGFADFNNTKAIIDPTTGTVNLAKMVKRSVNGVDVLVPDTNNTVPVNVLKGKILTEIKSFDVDAAMNNAKASLGTRIESIYNAATLSGAGTITKLTGPDALKKYPKFSDTINDFNKALSGMTASFLSDPHHLTSVLTMNTGKYDAESFTYDKAEADADASKILLKLNAAGLPVMDEKSKNYSTQYKEAEDWIKTQFMSKLDSERAISTTSQSQLQYRPFDANAYNATQTDKEAMNFGKNLAYLTTGDAAQKQLAVDYFKSVKGVKAVNTTLEGVDITLDSGTVVPYIYSSSTPNDFMGSIVKALNLEGLPENKILESARKNASKYITSYAASGIKTGTTITGKKVTPADEYDAQAGKLNESFIVKDDQDKSANSIATIVSDLGFSTKPTGWINNIVKVSTPDGKKSIEIDVGEDATTEINKLKAWMGQFTPEQKEQFYNINHPPR